MGFAFGAFNVAAKTYINLGRAIGVNALEGFIYDTTHQFTMEGQNLEGYLYDGGIYRSAARGAMWGTAGLLEYKLQTVIDPEFYPRSYQFGSSAIGIGTYYLEQSLDQFDWKKWYRTNR
jgi:hypothetical protein